MEKRWCDFLNCFFCQTNKPKDRDAAFTVTKDKEKQQIFTLQKLELLCLENDWNI